MSSEPAFIDDDVIDYRYYLDLLLTAFFKYYKLIAAFCILIVGLAVIVAISEEPTFSATVTMHVAPKETGMFQRWSDWTDEDKFQDTQIGLLQSNILHRRVVERLSLHEVGQLSPRSFNPGIGKRVRSLLSDTEDPVQMQDTTAEEIRATASELAGLISISKPPNREYSSLLNITVRSADPELSANIANTVAEEYMALVFETEVESAQKNERFLSERLTTLRADLRESEEKLQAFREDRNIISRDSGYYNEVDQELTALSTRLFTAREERLRQENLYEQISRISLDTDGWERLPALSGHPQVSAIQRDLIDLDRRKQELSKRYGSRHNTMIALESEIRTTREQLQDAVAVISNGIRSEYELALQIEKAAEQALDDARGRKQERGRQSFELNDLVQEVETKREVYSVFLERLNQDGAAGDARNDNIWIADPATIPANGQRTPVSRAAIIAFILSFGFSMGLGVLWELTRNRITTGEDVEKLKLPLLGYLPLVENHSKEEPVIILEEYLSNPDSRFAEALRTVRTAVSLGTIKQKGTTRLLITSTQTGEGKSSVSLSLASAFGQMSRVLIIDADLRKPSIGRILSKDRTALGLTDVLTNGNSPKQVIEHRERERFDVMYAGSPSIKPLELLGSKALPDMLDALEENYDIIIIDSPPCLPVSDAYIIGTHVDAVLFVVKSDTIPAPQVKKSLDGFSQTTAELAGVLVNQFNLDAAYNYHRYQGYYNYDGYGKTEAVGLSVVK